MKIFVVHDETGNIRSFGIPADSSEGGPVLESSRERPVSAVELPELETFSGEPRASEELFERLKTMRVDLTGKTPRLVPR